MRHLLFGLITVAFISAACGSTVVVRSDDDGAGASGAGASTGGASTGPQPNVGPGPQPQVGPGPPPPQVGPGPPPPPSMVTGPGGGICNSGLTTGSDANDACLTASCCIQFDACVADADCNACLVGAGVGCDSNTLLRSFESCEDESCTTDICGYGITFSDANGDPAFACNSCASTNCCAPLGTCVGGGTQAEVQNCLTCITDENSAACQALNPAVVNAAINFNACTSANCPACG